ncbi:hypothetical protein BCR33DRAFT_720046 [Rhizoclosmatium globosum]|uniref:Uncharacterized protein n=1 Tax=Rhizoclosmatium globosum TaxID=329046 RepID=A0A1Y2BXU2_9FUNG|nr:hypothetical protein BCR33DRAFT_720046 [Rhizoclosmatium globosum]|eukprot:ORY39590.1 hypothetical protein BCR33DRAFT_720046 [Rhizoclosmatium globosum]
MDASSKVTSTHSDSRTPPLMDGPPPGRFNHCDLTLADHCRLLPSLTGLTRPLNTLLPSSKSKDIPPLETVVSSHKDDCMRKTRFSDCSLASVANSLLLEIGALSVY